MKEGRSTEKAHVWIDLTDLAVWRGLATGVQRVVANLAEPLLEAGAHGFRYDPRQERLVEMDDALAVVRRIRQPGGEPIARQQPPLRQRVLDPERLYSYTLSRVWARMTRRVATSRPRLWRLGRTLLRNARRLRGRAEVRFPAGSVVLVLGMAWREPALLDHIARARHEVAVKVVELIYDLTPVLLPHTHPGLYERYRRYLQQVAELSEVVVVISETAAKDFTLFAAQEGFRIPPTAVLRLGDEIGPYERPKPPVPAPEAERYILCVSTFEVRKNHHLLYMVWRLAAERGIELPPLVLVGRMGWLTNDVVSVMRNDPAVRDKVSMLHDISDEELFWLYQHCLLTIYPSVYEGWGLPVAESLRLGKPVVASRTPSVQEIGGDLVEYFSPFDVAECLEVLIEQLDPDAMQARKTRIAERFSPQPWSASAAQLQATIEAVAPSSRTA